MLQFSSAERQVSYTNFGVYDATNWGIEVLVEAVAQGTASFGIDFVERASAARLYFFVLRKPKSLHSWPSCIIAFSEANGLIAKYITPMMGGARS